MHEISIGYDTGEYYNSSAGYTIGIHCKLIGKYKNIAKIEDPADALRFANWKATELGVGVDICSKMKEILGRVKKKKQKEKK